MKKRWAALALAAFFIFGGYSAAADNQVVPAAAPPASPAKDPSAAGSTTLDFANGLYARKMYGPAISEYEKFMQANPQSPEIASARFRYADSYYFTGNYKSAVFYFESFVKDFPADKRKSMALFRVASAKYYMNEIAEAVKTFLNLSKNAEDPNIRSGALFYLGKCYDQKTKSDKSLTVFQEILKNYPQTEYASYAGIAMGDHYLQKEQFDKAVEAYKVAAEKNNPAEISLEARFKIAEINFSRKDYAAAKGYYEKLFQDAPAAEQPSGEAAGRVSGLKDKAMLGLFYCDYYAHDIEASLGRLQANKAFVAQSQNEPDILYLIASLQAEKKDVDGAVRNLDAILSSPKTDPDLTEKAIFKKSEVLQAADKKESSLQELQKLFQKTTPSKNQARAYFERAEVLSQLGRSAEALQDYAAIRKDYPKTEVFKAALYQSALLQIQMKNPQAAKADFAEYAKQFSDENAEKAVLEMTQIDLDAKNFAEALKEIDGFITQFPKSAYLDIAYYKKGVALAGMQKFKEASEAFNALVSSYPNSKLHPDALYGVGSSLENAGDIKAALPFYEKIVSTAPDYPLANELLARLGYLYIQTGDLERACVIDQDILANRPQVRLHVDAAFWLVQYLLDHSRYQDMQKILALLPARFQGEDYSHEINFFMGESAMGLKDYVKAVEFYQKSVSVKSDGAYAVYAFLGMGIAHAAMNDAAQAEKDFNSALAYQDELRAAARARFEIANLRLKSGDFVEAAKAFMLVAILYDDAKYTPLALYQAGECFLKLEKPQEAEKAFVELRAHYPKSKWAKKLAEKETVSKRTDSKKGK